MTLLPPNIGRYEILGLLGAGGMAEVLLGRLLGPQGFERPVVIKRILPHLAREQHFVDMFLDEARIVAGIRHQNVVHVHELGQDGQELFLVMEYLEGESVAGLARRLSARRKLLSFGLCAHVIAEVCAGLHAAHELKDHEGRTQNLVHRDISPANIFVTYSGEVKILDFGIATAADRVSRTEAGQVKGKYAYMSPEQCMGRDLDRRSDIFSLGVVLYELSTCRRLYKRPSDMLTLQAICNDDVIPPSQLVSNYPPELEKVCLQALSRNKNQRYQSALEMRRTLLRVSQQLNEARVPEESLAKVMGKLFADRLEQKQKMLSTIRSGREVTSVPLAETDSSIELPTVVAADPVSKSSFSIPPSEIRPQSVSHRKAWLIGALAAGALVIVGTGILTMGGKGSADAESPQVPVVEAEVPNSAAVVPAATTSAAAAVVLPTKVKLDIDSEPQGAMVRIDGERRGETPLQLEVEHGETSFEVVLNLRDYREVTQSVVPNANQRLMVTLVRREPAAVAAPPRGKKPPRTRPPPKEDKPPPKETPPEPGYERFEDPYKRFN